MGTASTHLVFQLVLDKRETALTQAVEPYPLANTIHIAIGRLGQSAQRISPNKVQ